MYILSFICLVILLFPHSLHKLKETAYKVYNQSDFVQLSNVNHFYYNAIYNPYIFSACFFQGEKYAFGWSIKM